MKRLSLRVLEQLSELQASMQELSEERSTALKMFIASRTSTTTGAQREFWLEFSWLDQEYRVAVRRLAQFCSERVDDRLNSTVMR
ncbi:MAG TPA: hypothetical protein VLW26_11210 [Steroidobacteraceae bacterium]|nr:hypothetical protein [Steroidobacteraceae bacterium]